MFSMGRWFDDLLSADQASIMNMDFLHLQGSQVECEITALKDVKDGLKKTILEAEEQLEQSHHQLATVTVQLEELKLIKDEASVEVMDLQTTLQELHQNLASQEMVEEKDCISVEEEHEEETSTASVEEIVAEEQTEQGKGVPNHFATNGCAKQTADKTSATCITSS
ncbi:hypothetical protein MHYP_G00257840 [Metynnis hypsauchen]